MQFNHSCYTLYFQRYISMVSSLLYYYMQEQQVYFEKQSFFSLQCGLYSVNHLLNSKTYTDTAMKEICYELSDDFINPHKHPFGGDYDVNVLMVALSRQGLTTQWYDRRKLPFRLDSVNKDKQLVGLLVNVYTDTSFILHKIFRISRRHWFAVRRKGDVFYWMDSKQQTYHTYPPAELQKRLNDLLKNENGADQNTQMLLVYRDKK